ncbi:MAG: hypothetical protein AAF224_14595 [Pseudomonadota bacterium]
MGLLKFVGQLIAIAIVFVLIEIWLFDVDIDDRVASLLGNDVDVSDGSSEPVRDGVPATGEINEYFDGFGRLMYPGETFDSISVFVLAHEAEAHRKERAELEELFAIFAGVGVPDADAAYFGCGGNETNVAILVEGSNAPKKVLGDRAFLVGVAPFGSSAEPKIIMLYADENSDGDDVIDCKDGVKVAVYDFLTRSLWRPDVSFSGDSYYFKSFSQHQFLIESYSRKETLRVLFDVKAQNAETLTAEAKPDFPETVGGKPLAE